MALSGSIPFKNLKIFDKVTENDNRNLEDICKEVSNCVTPYDDVAEIIELKAYEMCENGHLQKAMDLLTTISDFFESLENKNEENCRNLADVYLLVGQMFQFAGKFNESITWFTKSIVVDDQYPVPYHNLAVSYEKLGKSDCAIRCLKQEICLAPGNYYSYLLLADLYKCRKMLDELEKCLHELLLRDPDNIMGLHRLIKHYEMRKVATDFPLLYNKIKSVNRNCNTTEWMIKVYYLCKEKKFSEALAVSELWQHAIPQTSLVHLVRAHIFGVQKKIHFRREEINRFLTKNRNDPEIINMKLAEFGSIFGFRYEKQVMKSLHK